MTERAMKVLLIEDDEIDAESVRRELSKGAADAPVEVDWAHELGAGLERLATDAFDLVLLDLGLPDSDGLETLDLLREHDGNVPVVVLTGAEGLASAVQAHGAQAYLMKGCLGASNDLLRAVRESVERQRLAREKLASLGVLSAGVAMGFNRLLGDILENAELAVADLADPRTLHRVRERLYEIQREALRAEVMTGQLRDYAAQSSLTATPLELSSFVMNASHLIDALVPDRIEVRYDLASGVVAARATPLQLHQVLIALVTNAIEAMSEQSGLLSIATALRDVDAATLRAAEGCPDAAPGRYASLSVSDTGRGMDEQVRRRVFEPFFSTKTPGRGLGLAAASGIARQFGAVIGVASAPGEGSRFDLLFPADGGSARERTLQ